MKKKKEDELLNSNYDGIQEYDNDLPKWWQALFLITILYGVVYVIYFHITSPMPSDEALKNQMAQIQKQQQSAPVETFSDASLLAFVSNPEKIAQGKGVFDGKCAACHGAQGQGLVGPNLTDDHWIHGGKISDIRRIVEVGVPDKGMVPWKGLLSAAEMDAVSAFIYSIHGTNPANPKAPQGEVVPRS